MFPMLDKESGKRKSMCGEETLYAHDGGKFYFCAEHMKVVKDFVRTKIRERKRGDRKPDGSMRISKVGAPTR